MSFSATGLNPALLDAVAHQGYQAPTPIQAAAIPVILNGDDLMAGAQTGTGKTAAFALPLIQQLSAQAPGSQPRALVLTPTRELAQQVYRNFELYSAGSGLRCALIYGGASINSQINALEAGADLIVATPGRLLDLMSRNAVQLTALRHLVFDEADRMLDMGFQDEIRRILKTVPEQRQTLLFSATFSSAIFTLSKTLLNNPTLIEVDARNTTARRVEQMVYAVDPKRKRELIAWMIGSKNWQQVLIFTRTKQASDHLANELNKDGLSAMAIHGDKSQGARERALESFRAGDTRVLVATDVAARGLDIDQLAYVVNFELPYNAEDYIHRIGRTGRAGGEGLAISLVSPEENYLLEDIETLLDARLPQQWLPGYEPDPTREIKTRNNRRGGQKKRARDRALGKKPTHRRNRR